MSDTLNVIQAMKKAHPRDKAPCKKAIQKMIYLIQEMKMDLGFDYRIHLYGPYSADLDIEMRYLCGRGDLIMTDEPGQGHLLEVDADMEVAAVSPEALRIISSFISKTPSDLELLTTALYVKRALPEAGIEEIIKGVIKIKGQKYSEEQIKGATAELQEKEYF